MSGPEKGGHPRHPAHAFRDRVHGRRDLPPAGELPGATVLRVAVLLALANYADADGIAAPGVVEVARLLNVDESSVRRATRWAVGVGLIERVGGGHRGRAAEWQLVTSPGKAGTSTPLSGEKGGHRPPLKAGTRARPTSGTSRGAAPKAAPHNTRDLLAVIFDDSDPPEHRPETRSNERTNP